MSDRGRDDHPTDARPLADGGTELPAGTTLYGRAAEQTGGAQATDAPGLEDDGQHPFGPAELPSWALALPLVGALAVAIGAQGSTVLAAGGGSAWFGTVAATVGLLVVLALALRSF